MVLCCLLTTPTILFQFYDHTIQKKWWFNVLLQSQQSWSYGALLLAHCSDYSFSILWSYDPKTVMIYCPTAVATVMNIWCSVARLLVPGTLTTWYPQYITSYLLLVLCIYKIKCYRRMMYRYTWRTPAQKRGLSNLLPKSSHIKNDTNGLWFSTPIDWSAGK